jgi:hypothetical protein
MQFRWVAGIALWTFFSGPVFGPPTANPQQSRKPTVTASAKQWRADTPHVRTPKTKAPKTTQVGLPTLSPR